MGWDVHVPFPPGGKGGCSAAPAPVPAIIQAEQYHGTLKGPGSNERSQCIELWSAVAWIRTNMHNDYGCLRISQVLSARDRLEATCQNLCAWAGPRPEWVELAGTAARSKASEPSSSTSGATATAATAREISAATATAVQVSMCLVPPWPVKQAQLA